MATRSLQRARDILNGNVPQGTVLGNAYWMNDDDLDSVGIVDLFYQEDVEDNPTYQEAVDLTIDTSEEISSLDSLGDFPFSSLITSRTFQVNGAGLDFDLATVFDDDENERRLNGQYEFASEHGLALAIDSNRHVGFNLGQFVTDSIYSLVTFSPLSVRSSSPKSFFDGIYF